MTRHKATKTKSIFKLDRLIIYNLCFHVRNTIPCIEVHLLFTKSMFGRKQKKLEAFFLTVIEIAITRSKFLTFCVNKHDVIGGHFVSIFSNSFAV